MILASRLFLTKGEDMLVGRMKCFMQDDHYVLIFMQGIPQQSNSDDCGVFLLQVHAILKAATYLIVSIYLSSIIVMFGVNKHNASSALSNAPASAYTTPV